MGFAYHWKRGEANFGPPIEEQVPGGTHITFEVVLTMDGQYVALRRPRGIPDHEIPTHASKHPEGLCYFCHGLIRYGESVEACVSRLVREQAGVGVRSIRIIDIDSHVQEKDGQWAFNPIVLASLDALPSVSEEITEVVVFDAPTIPTDLAWWSIEEMREFIESLADTS